MFFIMRLLGLYFRERVEPDADDHQTGSEPDPLVGRFLRGPPRPPIADSGKERGAGAQH